ncbi:MAG: amidohydrolase [Ilumatobacteraceae bacterium]
MEAPSEIVVYRARSVHTMDPDASVADAVAVRADRVIAVGRLDEVLEAVTDGPVRTDDTFADAVLLPGLIDQHLHPLLGATTLATEVIATEDWVLPGRVLPAASSPGEYDERLRAAHSALEDPDEWLLSWGYHGLWHGELDRDRLDAISSSRPIGIWHRSCHEWFMNSAAIDRIGLTADSIDGLGRVADTIDVERGRAWEVGFFQHVLPLVAPVLLSRERMEFGLHQMVRYLHSNGVTAFNEPGIAWAFEPVDLYREILGAPDCPILSTFMIDGRSLAATGRSPDEAVAAARSQLDRLPPTGKVSLFRDQVKFFADGAIISQLMMMREPYLDRDGQPDLDHHGEWLMEPEVLRAHLSAFWDAGWQVHTHVNGDAGLDVLLDVLEECRRRTPRDDHRSVIVHFANSTEEQIDRIARLGAIVSANPYYPVGFADKYGEFGLGPERAAAMVRARSVLERGIPLSFHSDLPMAPSDPLFLARCAVERRTPSGRIAGPEQRIDVHDALRAVTVEAAWSWRMEDELGSIEPGKRATFTVLDRDPYEPDGLSTATVLGTVYDGKWFPVDRGVDGAVPDAAGAAVTGWAGPVGAGCTCGAARALARAWDGLRAA